MAHRRIILAAVAAIGLIAGGLSQPVAVATAAALPAATLVQAPTTVSQDSTPLSTPTPPAIQLADPATATPDSSTELSNTYSLGHGVVDHVEGADIANVRDASGNWVPASSDVSAEGSGKWAAADNPLHPVFSSKANADETFTVSQGGYSASFGLEGAAAVSPTQTDAADTGDSTSQLQYEDVLPNIDLDYTVADTQMSESMILDQAPFVPEQLVWDISAPGLTLVQQTDGSIQFDDSLGTVELSIPGSTMWDSSGPNGVADSLIEAVPSTLTEDGSIWKYTLLPSQTWLTDPSRVFPVTIDPTVTPGVSSEGAFRSDGATSGGIINVGNSRADGDTYWRSILRYGFQPPSGYQVVRSALGATYDGSGTTSAETGGVYTESTSCSTSGYSCLGTNLGSLAVSSGTSGSGTDSSSAFQNEIAAEFRARTQGPHFELTGNAAAGSYTYKKLAPSLSIGYVAYPSAVNASPSNSSAGISVVPTLTVNGTDPTGDGLTYIYSISTSSDFSTGTVWTSSPTTSSSISLPANAPLNTNTTYYWHAQVEDEWQGTLGDNSKIVSPTSTFVTSSNHMPQLSTITVSTSADPNDATIQSAPTSPTVSGSASDADGDALTLAFTAYTTDDTSDLNPQSSCSTAATSGNPGSCVLSPDLVPNTQYVVIAEVSDGALTSAPISSSIFFVDDAADTDSDPDDVPSDPSDETPTTLPSDQDLETEAATSDADQATDTDDNAALDPLQVSADAAPDPSVDNGCSDPTLPDGSECAITTTAILSTSQQSAALSSMSAVGGPTADADPNSQSATGSFQADSFHFPSATHYPTWCPTKGSQSTQERRFEKCRYIGFDSEFYRVENGEPTWLGSADGLQAHYIKSFYNAGLVDSDFAMLITSTAGSVSDIHVTANATGPFAQSSNCTSLTSEFADFAVTSTSWHYGNAVCKPDVSPDSKVTVQIAWSGDFVKTGWGAVAGFTGIVTLTARCDSGLAGPGVGCAMPGDAPGLSFSESAYPSFAKHVQNAIETGLPGGSADDPLHRRTDQSAITKSRSVACPSKLKRPTGDTCDEYPFASTQEGAKAGGQARTFPWCHVSGDLYVSGSHGFSRCMIATSDNSGAGGKLGSNYYHERLIDGDAFWVKFVS